MNKRRKVELYTPEERRERLNREGQSWQRYCEEGRPASSLATICPWFYAMFPFTAEQIETEKRNGNENAIEIGAFSQWACASTTMTTI